MRRNISGNLGLYKYLWPGSVGAVGALHLLHSRTRLICTPSGKKN